MKEQMKEKDEEKLFTDLTTLCEQIAGGRYKKAKHLFEMTKKAKYPPLITRLAEAFDMMTVKVETREYHLEEIIETHFFSVLPTKWSDAGRKNPSRLVR